MNEQTNTDYLKEDLDNKKGLNKQYASSLHNVISTLGFLIENEPNMNLKKKTKEFRDLYIQRQDLIHKKFYIKSQE
jgi:hypothetical protein